MTTLQSIDSLALFGSMPRGDFDQHSDRDILVVTDHHSESIEMALNKAGYSPSTYKWQQLEDLSRDGSLFLQHLKQESHVLVDRAGRLHSLLEEYQPRRDYTSRLIENRGLFEITQGTPDTLPAISWAFDVLAVAFRNQAILHFAQQGLYLFSYSALMRNIVSEFALSSAEAELLSNLRIKKRGYRAHPSVSGASLIVLKQTQSLLERMFQVQCVSSSESSHVFVKRLLRLETNDLHWYHALRCYEGVYRAMGFVPTHDASPMNAKLEYVFANPSPYCSTGMGSIEWARAYVHQCAVTYLASGG